MAMPRRAEGSCDSVQWFRASSPSRPRAQWLDCLCSCHRRRHLVHVESRLPQPSPLRPLVCALVLGRVIHTVLVQCPHSKESNCP